MMPEIDTSAQAVERLAAALEHDQSAVEDVGFMLVVADNPPEKIAATLRALAAERDEAQRLVNEARGERDEAIATLSLYRMENGCTRNQRTTQFCAEAAMLRHAWLRVIQFENSCEPTGAPCKAKLCGCKAEQEMLIEDACKGSSEG